LRYASPGEKNKTKRKIGDPILHIRPFVRLTEFFCSITRIST